MERRMSEMTTVGEMRRIARKILFQMEGWDADDKIMTTTNTYFVGGYALETKDGFVDWTDIILDGDDFDEEEEEDDWEEEDE